MNYQTLFICPAYLLEWFAIIIPCLSWVEKKSTVDGFSERQGMFADFRISSRMESQSAKNGVRRETVPDWHCCCFESKWKKTDSLCSHWNIQRHCARASLCSLHCPGVPMATGSLSVKRMDMQVFGVPQWRPRLSAGTAFTHFLLIFYSKAEWSFALNGF